MRPLKDVLLCAAAGALCLGLVVVLDVVTGVPFSSGVPLAALLSLIPYAFVVSRVRGPRRASQRAHAHTAGAVARVGARVGARVDDDEEVEDAGDAPRPCAIHSVIFVGTDAGPRAAGVGTPTQNAA
jgi:hypothetical protein